jgi:DNA-directed RNA polymerase subunit M/transcription elongation factor TFIIS
MILKSSTLTSFNYSKNELNIGLYIEYTLKMKYFCDHCRNLLDVNTTNDVLSFKCLTCYTSYDADEDDTLRYEDSKSSNLIIFNKILSKAVRDPVNIKANVTCPKCKHDTAKRVRLGEELRLINICTACTFQWIEM